MPSPSFPLKVLGTELFTIALGGVLIFFYVQAVNKKNRMQASQPPPAASSSTQSQALAAEYKRNGKSVTDLLSALSLRKETDLITFVVDTSQSMADDRQELKDNIKKIMGRYKGKSFELVDFTGRALVTGEPTRDAAELQNRLEQSRDLGGSENSYNALLVASDHARQQFKYPAIVLLTDAAPNDGTLGSSSSITLAQAADALNAANAELHIFAAFDAQEYMTGGAAATTDLYPQLLSKVRAGGEIHTLKR